MLLRQLIFPLVTAMLLLPATGNASEIEVQAGTVRINTSRDGSIDVNTGQTQLQVPSNRSYFPMNSRFTRHNSQDIRMSCSRNRNYVRQETRQITRSNQHSSQTYISTYQDC